jgi:hypothetical protein
MCNITCIYNEICHITNEIFQAQITTCMINLFNRLPVQPSEAERLNILRRNLLPYFIHGIGLIDIETVSQLTATCKKLEVTKSLATASRAVNPKASLLEPDLADDTSVRPKPVRKSVAAVSCWNCQHTGHVFLFCNVMPHKLV